MTTEDANIDEIIHLIMTNQIHPVAYLERAGPVDIINYMNNDLHIGLRNKMLRHWPLNMFSDLLEYGSVKCITAYFECNPATLYHAVLAADIYPNLLCDIIPSIPGIMHMDIFNLLMMVFAEHVRITQSKLLHNIMETEVVVDDTGNIEYWRDQHDLHNIIKDKNPENYHDNLIRAMMNEPNMPSVYELFN